MKVIFLCHGNICRSPMAEYIFKYLIDENHVSHLFEVCSRATSNEEYMNDIYQLSSDSSDDFELQIHLFLTQIWHQLYQFYIAQPRVTAKPKQHLSRLRDILFYIDEHYNQDITLEDVAKKASICKSECCRFFKKHMGITIFDYILYLRIQNSLPLLKKLDSITDVSAMVGFSSPSYYTQIFKRYMKCTPLEYIREGGKL